ncbi:TetR family transcriptional regulator C-terminal domain-containing protein [Phytomonospora sp. NPDC050363]|uniref:TetR/AcrR family transcriptional regulator n=1 Tax=Phytomonospora sp. NPDC050363 TaxID=3155642 RepID=UPI00340A53D1
MPARGDHDARRRDLSEAVWRVVAAEGFTGLTMRAVAAELGASTGLVTHYFPSKTALVRHALDLAAQRVDAMPRRTPDADGMAALRAAILDVLPLGRAGQIAMNRVWVSSWDLALADDALGEAQRERYARWRERLRRQVQTAQERGELPAGDPEDVSATVAAFTHGLVTQALFDPEEFPAVRQERLVEGFLAGLAGAG